jgi:hypothetical protein
MRFLNGQ